MRAAKAEESICPCAAVYICDGRLDGAAHALKSAAVKRSKQKRKGFFILKKQIRVLFAAHMFVGFARGYASARGARNKARLDEKGLYYVR